MRRMDMTSRRLLLAAVTSLALTYACTTDGPAVQMPASPSGPAPASSASSPSLPPAAAGADCGRGEAPTALPKAPGVPPAPSPAADGSYAPHVRVLLALYQDCRSIRVGDEVTIRVLALSGSAALQRTSLTVEGSTVYMALSCAPPSDQQRPKPTVYQDDIVHKYRGQRTDKVVVTVSTGCSHFQGESSATVSVEVLPAL